MTAAAIPLELLAPAGNADIGIAAIDHGADAVYIGAPRFSARADAAVGIEDIARLIRHAHFYNAKVYVALNTILTDAELPYALEIIREVFRLGADGLILQDTGLLELDLPPIPLIASTQMHNDTPEKVRFLETVGFKRVILARELSLEDISSIRRETTVELEAFVYGALCVSYSGQCYMSQAATGRSGNRGVCAQPCRSLYTLTDGGGRLICKEKFLLSLKDMNRIEAIPDLAAAGVTSFKIEGRYKGADYVKNVTAAFRQAIDRFIADNPGYRRASSGTCSYTFTPDPARTFNRGYTRYFLDGRREKVASIDTQKSIGRYVGTIAATGKDFFRIDCRDLTNGDGLCFFTREGDLAGFRIDRIDGGKVYPGTMSGLKTGTLLYRNHDMAFSRILKKTSARRLIGVVMEFSQEEDRIRLVVRDEDGNEAEMTREVPFEPPRDPSRALKEIREHLTSTGNSPYRVDLLTARSGLLGFIPLSTVNSIRRDALEALTGIKLERYHRQTIPFVPNDSPYPRKELDFHANVLNEQARRFYERHGARIVERAFETIKNANGRTVMTTRYCIRYHLDLCPKQRRTARLPEEPLRLEDKHHRYRLEFDCRRCRMAVILEGV